MTATTVDTTRRAPAGAITAYFLTAFAVAWILWLVAWSSSKGLIAPVPMFLVLCTGAFGPFFGAAVATAIEGGPTRTLRFFARGLDPRMGWVVFLLAFCLMPALCVLAVAINALRTHGQVAFTMTWAEFPQSYLFLFFLGGAVNEEFGWSYLSDKFDDLMPVIPGTLILGIIWAVWHLPLFYIVMPGMIQHYTPFSGFLIGCVAMRFLFSWAYHRSGRNILSNIVFHNASNLGYSIVAVAPSAEAPDTTAFWILTGLAALCAAAIWLFKPIRHRAPAS